METDTMFVYVLEGLLDYEGGTVLGAYTTRAAAEAAARADAAEDAYDDYVVHRIEVGAPTECRLFAASTDYVNV